MAALQPANQLRWFDGSHFQRAGHAEKLIPVRRDQLPLQAMAGNSVEHAITGFMIEAPISRIPEIRQPRAELKSQQPEQPENQIGVAGRVGDDLLWLQLSVRICCKRLRSFW